MYMHSRDAIMGETSQTSNLISFNRAATNSKGNKAHFPAARCQRIISCTKATVLVNMRLFIVLKVQMACAAEPD